MDMKSPNFQVKRNFNIWTKTSTKYKVILGLDGDQPYKYTIMGNNRDSDCKILDKFEEVVAELKRKKTKTGVVLGKDVFTMEIKSSIDHSLIMGLFVVYNLINSKM